jgi:SPP1 family predicted phage head-tail adaptor
MSGLDTGKLNRRITLQGPSTTRVGGRPSTAWGDIATIWADVQDVRPSKAEQLAEGLNIANRPCRIIVRFREDITPGMRVLLDGRTLHVVSMPAELGRREGTEFMAEELTTAGQEP